MWCCLPQKLYQALTGEQIVAPLQPLAIPPFNDLATPAHNAAIQVTWQKNKELWDQKKNVNKVLIKITKSALDVAHRCLLTNLFVSTPQHMLVEFYDSLFVKWGQANPHDLVANQEWIKTPWGPNEHDIADVIKQIHDGALFRHYVGQNFDDKRLVTIEKK